MLLFDRKGARYARASLSMSDPLANSLVRVRCHNSVLRTVDLNELEPEIALVLSPITTTSRQDERESWRSPFLGLCYAVDIVTWCLRRHLATIPTVGDALVALSDVCNDLADTIKHISDMSAELAAKEHIGVDNIQEASSFVFQVQQHNDDSAVHRSSAI